MRNFCLIRLKLVFFNILEPFIFADLGTILSLLLVYARPFRVGGRFCEGHCSVAVLFWFAKGQFCYRDCRTSSNVRVLIADILFNVLLTLKLGYFVAWALLSLLPLQCLKPMVRQESILMTNRIKRNVLVKLIWLVPKV